MALVDVVILTDPRFVGLKKIPSYAKNAILEDKLVQDALEKQGLKTRRLSWDDANFDWSSTKFALFRTTWDYFERFDEFSTWLDIVSKQTTLINSSEIINWNIDKHYLKDLEEKGVYCVPTLFIEPGSKKSLTVYAEEMNWDSMVLKPAVSGNSWHTYRLDGKNIKDHEAIFKELIETESLLLQEFQKNIVSEGEKSLVIIDGIYSHAVLKIAKKGDFRVQDDFGGSVHSYTPTKLEIDFAKRVIEACSTKPIYARVDIITDNHGHLALAELELVEPELWFRQVPKAATMLAMAIKQRM